MAKYKYRHRETYKGVDIDIRANTSADLLAKIAKKKRAIDSNTVDSSMKFSKFITLYLETYKKNAVSKRWYDDLTRMGNNIVAAVGDKPIGKIKPIELQAFLNGCTGFSDGYIKKYHDLISQIFKYAYRNGITATDFNWALERPKGKKNKIGRSITENERKALLKVLDGHRGEIFFKLMLYCGLRPGEVSALLWKDIDFKTGTLSVNKAQKINGEIGEPKSAAGNREIPIPDHFILTLKRAQGNPFSFVCLRANGNPHSPKSRKTMWNNIRKMMNIEMGCKVKSGVLIPPYPLADDFRPYFLRHTYCTDLEKMGVPINIASRLMGHSSISITSKIYTHASDESLNIARNLINGALEMADVKK